MLISSLVVGTQDDIFIIIIIKGWDKRHLGLCSLKISKASGPLSCCSVIEIHTECLMMMSR